MSLEFVIDNGQGVNDTLSTQDVVKQLQESGENVVGTSADGSMIRLADEKGEFNVRAADLLRDHGWEVKGMAPLDASYDHINSDWRQAISVLPSDEHKQAYIEGQLKKSGISGAQVIGSGRDWYAFDPESNRYVALTNNPDWDMSDASEAMVGAPRAIGSLLGGAGGAILGGGANPLTGAAGAGLGGAAADSLTRYVLAQSDPTLKEVMSSDMGAMAKDVLKGASLDAITQGAFLGAPKVLGSLLGKETGQAAKSFLESGPLSTAARSLGGMAEEGGRIANKVARVADTSLGREVASLAIPGVGDATAIGALGQIPGQAVRGIARGIGSLGQTNMAKTLSPEGAEQLVGLSKNLTRKSFGPSNFTNRFSQGADQARNFIAGNSPIPKSTGGTTEDVLGNLGELLGGGGGRQKVLRDTYTQARRYGIGAEEAKKIADQAAEESLSEAARASRDIGRKIGRGVQNVENFSKGVENFGKGVTGATLKGVRAGSYAAGKGGSVVKNAAKIAQPIENRAYLRYGAEEMWPGQISPSESWQEERKRAKLGSILAAE